MPSPAGVPPIITRVQDPDRDPNRCAWFLLCDAPASLTVTHPTLGDVPACRRCLVRVGLIVEGVGADA